MSGYSETTTCPRCGADSLEASIDRDEVSGMCFECGYEYHTVDSILSLEEVNEERVDCEMEPLEKLREPNPAWFKGA